MNVDTQGEKNEIRERRIIRLIIKTELMRRRTE